jgi:serine/threonine-protein kinase
MENTPDLGQKPALLQTDTALPLDLLERALRRMSWVGIALSLSAAGVYLEGRYLQPGWINPAYAPRSYLIGLAMTTIIGLTLGALPAIRSLSTVQALDLGLILQCAAGLAISIAENSVPRLEGEVVRGTSSVAVWIAIFALAVPARFGKALSAALATAAMGPLGLTIQVALGNGGRPPLAVCLALFSGNFLFAFGAAGLSKLIYRLGTQVKEAREFGGYQLVRCIGSGGMGEVWLARHRLIGREAAVKLITRQVEAGSRPGWRDNLDRRFGREARAIASLHSPHTVSLYGYGFSEQGFPYYVMELLDGIDLDTLASRFGPVCASRAIYILLQVCDSLAEAHEAGLTHRDVKPRNIMVCRLGVNCDFVKVVDFGLVKPTSSANLLETGGEIGGTPSFLAPEVARGLTADARTDLYGVGCVAYWLLTGHLPFERATAIAAAAAHVTDTPTPPSQRTDNEIPAQLERIVLACLAKDRAERPQTASELGLLLRRAAPGLQWTREDAEEWWRTNVPGKLPASAAASHS